jgi:hypothetical protein
VSGSDGVLVGVKMLRAKCVRRAGDDVGWVSEWVGGSLCSNQTSGRAKENAQLTLLAAPNEIPEVSDTEQSYWWRCENSWTCFLADARSGTPSLRSRLLRSLSLFSSSAATLFVKRRKTQKKVQTVEIHVSGLVNKKKKNANRQQRCRGATDTGTQKSCGAEHERSARTTRTEARRRGLQLYLDCRVRSARGAVVRTRADRAATAALSVRRGVPNWHGLAL